MNILGNPRHVNGPREWLTFSHSRAVYKSAWNADWQRMAIGARSHMLAYAIHGPDWLSDAMHAINTALGDAYEKASATDSVDGVLVILDRRSLGGDQCTLLLTRLNTLFGQRFSMDHAWHARTHPNVSVTHDDIDYWYALTPLGQVNAYLRSAALNVLYDPSQHVSDKYRVASLLPPAFTGEHLARMPLSAIVSAVHVFTDAIRAQWLPVLDAFVSTDAAPLVLATPLNLACASNGVEFRLETRTASLSSFSLGITVSDACMQNMVAPAADLKLDWYRGLYHAALMVLVTRFVVRCLRLFVRHARDLTVVVNVRLGSDHAMAYYYDTLIVYPMGSRHDFCHNDVCSSSVLGVRVQWNSAV